jgi:hypothetical protein
MLNEEESKTLEGIKANPYMQKTVALVENFVKNYESKDKGVAYLAFFDEVFRILNGVKSFVDEYLIECKHNINLSLKI